MFATFNGTNGVGKTTALDGVTDKLFKIGFKKFRGWAKKEEVNS